MNGLDPGRRENTLAPTWVLLEVSCYVANGGDFPCRVVEPSLVFYRAAQGTGAGTAVLHLPPRNGASAVRSVYWESARHSTEIRILLCPFAVVFKYL